jgi:hypothetical protein
MLDSLFCQKEATIANDSGLLLLIGYDKRSGLLSKSQTITDGSIVGMKL